MLEASRSERGDRSAQKVSAEVRTRVEEEYHRKYLEKLAEMQENTRAHEEERIMRVFNSRCYVLMHFIES